MDLTLRYGARSDRGTVRPVNQDSVYAGPRLLAVADGMGGMAAGDLASSITIATMAPLDGAAVPGPSPSPDPLIDRLRVTAHEADRRIGQEVEADPTLRGMGTTLTALLLAGDRIGLVHIGDSRAYRLRNGAMQQVTKDDTYVQMLVDEGAIGPAEAAVHPQRAFVTRVLQGQSVEARYSVRPGVPGDRYLLCSDGLSDSLPDASIAAVLGEHTDPQACADQLVELALRNRATDNVTAIVADVTAGVPGDEAPIIAGAVVDRLPAT